jgi:hypothetical protein
VIFRRAACAAFAACGSINGIVTRPDNLVKKSRLRIGNSCL